MLLQRIKQKFAEKNLKVLFFFDPEEEYKEALKEIEETEIKLIIANQNYFQIKYLIEEEWSANKIFLYHSFSRPAKNELTEYPLTDLLLANQELIIDPTADIMDQLNIDHKFGSLLRKYKRWVNAKKYQNLLLPILTEKQFNPNKFLSAIISLIIGEKRTANETYNLIKIFEHLNDGESNWEKLSENISRYQELEEHLKETIYRLTNLEVEDLSFDSLKSLFLKLKYNIITLSIAEAGKEDRYAKLKFSDELSRAKVDLFFKEWRADREKFRSFENVFNRLGADVDEDAIMEAYGIHSEYGVRTQKILSIVINHAFKDVIIQPETIIERFTPWRNNPDEYSGFESHLGFLINAAKFFSLLKNYSDFDFNYLDEYVERYRKELHKLDLHYRHAFTWYQRLDREISNQDAKTVFDELNAKYDQYVIELNNGWMKILDENAFDLNSTKATKQYNFYNTFVKSKEHKKVVIISDAFRYELAVDLQEALMLDSNNRMETHAMLASIPSYTNLGMTNLLPNRGIKTVITADSIDYSINDIASGSQNRGKILRAFEPDSVAIGFASFNQMNLSEQRDLLKQNRVVYIYHNWMDSIGDKKSSEYYTFESVEQCVEQLSMLIQRLYKSLNTYNIIVTADHGFLFNYREIPEASRQPFPTVKSILKEHTRFYLTEDKMKPEGTYMFPLSNTTNFDSDVNVIIPKAINRFRKKGAVGVQFVHGGSSLQEIVVPVFELYRNRRNKAKDVTFRRLDKLKSMSTSSAFFKILQDHPVGEEYKPLDVQIAIYDLKNEPITSEYELTLNSTGEFPSGRTFEFKLELNAAGARARTGYLRAFAKSDIEKLNPLLNDLIKINTLTEIDEF